MGTVFEFDPNDEKEADAMHAAAQIVAALAGRPDIAVMALLHALDMIGAIQMVGSGAAPATLN